MKQVGVNSFISESECSICTLEHEGKTCVQALQEKLAMCEEDMKEIREYGEDYLPKTQDALKQTANQCKALINNLSHKAA